MFVLARLGELLAFAHVDLHERITELAQRIQNDPASFNLRLERADTLRLDREFADALADVEAAEKILPHQPATQLERARIWFDSEHFSRTVVAASECLTLSPANADALVLRARAYARLNLQAKAIEDYSAVLESARRPLPDLFLERARCQAVLGRFADAVHGLDEGMAKIGRTPSLAFPALDYERRRGDFSAAQARLENMRDWFDQESFLALRGEIHLQAGASDEALLDFNRALDLLKILPDTRRSTTAVQELAERLKADLQKTDATKAPK